MGLFPLAAALVSGAFSASVIRQYFHRRGCHQLAWGVALATFAVASACAAFGMIAGWSASVFRVYYLFGAVVNVPILALGTVYLYFPRRVGHGVALAVAAACFYAGAAVFNAQLNVAALNVTGNIPMGSEVMAAQVRALSRYYSYLGFLVVVAGAIWSALKLARRPEERFKRLAQGNGLIALGTAVLAVGSVFARQGQGSVFAVGLAVGVSIMYTGFLRTASRDGRVKAEPTETARGPALPGTR